MGKSSIVVSAHGEFLHAVSDGVSRYYPPSQKSEAIAAASEKVVVRTTGFAVFDTTVSTIYAVALYPSAAEAEAHKPASPAPAPKNIYEDHQPSETDEKEATTGDSGPMPTKRDDWPHATKNRRK